MGCKKKSINGLKRKKEEEDKGRKNKIFKGKRCINRRNNNKGGVPES